MNNFMNVTQKNIKQTNVKTNNTKSSNKTENGTAIVMAGKETDKNLFLKLLVAQISHQDPMNPQDPTQYITQLAQFNTLEQMQNLNNSMGNIEGLTNGVLENLAMGTASSMIGKHIEAYDPDEININEIRKTKDNEEENKKNITGVVESIEVKNGIVYMDVRVDKTSELKSIEYGSLIKASEDK